MAAIALLLAGGVFGATVIGATVTPRGREVVARVRMRAGRKQAPSDYELFRRQMARRGSTLPFREVERPVSTSVRRPGERAVSAVHTVARDLTVWKNPDILVDFTTTGVPVGGTLSWYDYLCFTPWDGFRVPAVGSASTESLDGNVSTAYFGPSNYTNGFLVHNAYPNPFVLYAGHRTTPASSNTDIIRENGRRTATGGTGGYNRLSEMLLGCRTSGWSVVFVGNIKPYFAADTSFALFEIGGTATRFQGDFLTPVDVTAVASAFPDQPLAQQLTAPAQFHTQASSIGAEVFKVVTHVRFPRDTDTSYWFNLMTWYEDTRVRIPIDVNAVMVWHIRYNPSDADTLGAPTYSIFLNGNLLLKRTTDVYSPAWNGNMLRLGNVLRSFTGAAYELRMYSLPLTNAEYLALYASRYASKITVASGVGSLTVRNDWPMRVTFTGTGTLDAAGVVVDGADANVNVALTKTVNGSIARDASLAAVGAVFDADSSKSIVLSTTASAYNLHPLAYQTILGPTAGTTDIGVFVAVWAKPTLSATDNMCVFQLGGDSSASLGNMIALTIKPTDASGSAFSQPVFGIRLLLSSGTMLFTGRDVPITSPTDPVCFTLHIWYVGYRANVRVAVNGAVLNTPQYMLEGIIPGIVSQQLTIGRRTSTANPEPFNGTIYAVKFMQGSAALFDGAQTAVGTEDVSTA